VAAARPTNEDSEFTGDDIAAYLARKNVTTRQLGPAMEPPVSHQRAAQLLARQRPLSQSMVDRIFVAVAKITADRERADATTSRAFSPDIRPEKAVEPARPSRNTLGTLVEAEERRSP
jgi:hypothetical protein